MTSFPEPHQPNPSHRKQETNFIVVSDKDDFVNENSHGCAVWRTACKWLHGTVFAHAVLCGVSRRVPRCGHLSAHTSCTKLHGTYFALQFASCTFTFCISYVRSQLDTAEMFGAANDSTSSCA